MKNPELLDEMRQINYIHESGDRLPGFKSEVAQS